MMSGLRATYRFRLVMSGRRNFRPGDEREFSQIDDAPLQIATRPVAPPPSLGTLPAAAGRR